MENRRCHLPRIPEHGVGICWNRSKRPQHCSKVTFALIIWFPHAPILKQTCKPLSLKSFMYIRWLPSTVHDACHIDLLHEASKTRVITKWKCTLIHFKMYSVKFMKQYRARGMRHQGD